MLPLHHGPKGPSPSDGSVDDRIIGHAGMLVETDLTGEHPAVVLWCSDGVGRVSFDDLVVAVEIAVPVTVPAAGDGWSTEAPRWNVRCGLEPQCRVGRPPVAPRCDLPRSTQSPTAL